MTSMPPEVAHTLVVLRHAKSDWPDDVPDHHRPLAKRGRKDAPVAGTWLRKAGYIPDRVACSTARRTRQTWELVAESLRADPEVVHDERIYEASVRGLFAVIRETPEQVGTLLLIGHNPGMHGLVMSLAGDGAGDLLRHVQDAFPTSATAVLRFTGTWSALESDSARLIDFKIPRG